MFGRTNKEVIFSGEYDSGLWNVEVDRGQIEQVIMNLLSNAHDAIAEERSAKIDIESENTAITKLTFEKHIADPATPTN